jgi:predicted PurR-regulated permease PerM
MLSPEPPPEPRPVAIRFDPVNVALATAMALLVVEAFRFIEVIQGVLVLLLLAVILATAIEPLVVVLRRVGFERGYSVLLIYLVIVSVVVVLLVLMGQVVVGQLAALVTSLPYLSRRISDLALTLPAGLAQNLALNVSAAISSAQTRISLESILANGTFSGLLFATVSFVEAIFAAVTVLVLAYFWVAERLAIRRLVVRALPVERRPQALTIWETVEQKLGAWARGQLLLMVVVGTVQGVGYSMLGVPFAALLAVFAGAAEVIPMIGPYIGAAPAVLVALTQSWQLALLVVGYTVVVELVESNILVPRIFEHAVGLSPLTVIVALLVGAAAYGVLGALLAVPIAAAIQAVIAELKEY